MTSKNKVSKKSAKKNGSKKKSGSKKTVTKKIAEKAGSKKMVAKKTAQKAGSKKTAQKAGSKKTAQKEGSKKVVTKKTNGKKVVAKNVSVKKVRSFKVLLPGSEQYCGRFTGLTPYQAANKALSKYYRENKGKTAQISFTIKESTRASKRNVYKYKGKRIKLDTPIEYTINGGKVITKRFKNKLNKIKKNALVNSN